jgi:hypothetical protein
MNARQAAEAPDIALRLPELRLGNSAVRTRGDETVERIAKNAADAHERAGRDRSHRLAPGWWLS